MIKIAVVGATGLTGIELIKLLTKHSKIKKMDLFSFSNAGKDIKNFSKELNNYSDILKDFTKICFDDYDLIFFACPNGTFMNSYKNIKDSKTKFIDLAADYRLDDEKIWEKYYGEKHKSPNVLSKIVYGLTEINRKNIKDANIVANPGCYPTAAIIALYPLIQKKVIDIDNIIIDAKSGYSGAGRQKIESGLNKRIQNNFIPYNFYKHRHHPEIIQELNKAADSNVKVIFSPHILPLYRGILETIYVNLNQDIKLKDIIEIYNEYYSDESFIKLKDSNFIEIKDVINTNNVHLSLHINKDKLTILSAIDNLIKGAAGQAVQNMNVMMNYDELTALKDE